MFDENRKYVTAEKEIPELVKSYFSESENARDLKILHSWVLDLIWEASEEEGFGARGGEIAVQLVNLYSGHYYARHYGLVDSAEEISKAFSDAVQHRDYHFTPDIIRSEAMNANPKAISLLVRLAAYDEEDNFKSIKKIILNAHEHDSRIRPLVTAEVKRWMNDCPELMSLAEAVDPNWVFRRCIRYLSLPEKYSYPDALITASRLKLSDNFLLTLLGSLEKFWSNEEWKENEENRKAFYSIVQQGHQRGVIDSETAIDYMYGLFENRFIEDLGGEIKAVEVLQEVAQEKYGEVVYNAVLMMFGGEESLAEADNKTIDNILGFFNAFQKNLDFLSAKRLLIALMKKSNFHDLVFYTVDSLTRFPADEEIRHSLEEVFETKSDEKLYCLGSFFMRIRKDPSYKNLRKKWGSLPDIVIGRLKKESDPTLRLTLIEMVVQWGSPEDVEFAFPYLDKMFKEAEVLSIKMIIVALMCCIAVRKADRKKKVRTNAALKMLEREHVARKGEFVEMIYALIARGGVEYENDNNIIFPAIEFVSLVKPVSSVPFVSGLLAGENPSDELDYPMKSACVEHLRIMAMHGNREALEIFGTIPEAQQTLGSSPLANLARIVKDSAVEEIRERAIVLSSERLASILMKGSYSEIETAMESIRQIRKETLIQECMLASLEHGLCYKVNEDISCAVSKIPSYITPNNLQRAIFILKASMHLIAWKLKEKEDAKLNNLEVLMFEILNTLRKLEIRQNYL